MSQQWRAQTQDEAYAALSSPTPLLLSTPGPTFLRDVLERQQNAVLHNNAPTLSEVGAVATAESVEIAALREKVDKLTKENEAIKQEKRVWLSRLQVDNRKLGLMFQDVEETKRRLINEIDSIQTEKARLRALQLSVSEDILDRLLQGSRLAPTALKLLPVEKRTQASELYENLTQLITQCRENQVEVLQCVGKHAQEVESGFHDGTPAGETRKEASLAALKNIASTLPGNLLAAEAVAASLSEAMVCALMEKSSLILARRAEAVTAAAVAAGEGTTAVGKPNEKAMRNVIATGGGAGAAAVDVKTLQAQVESLQKAQQEMRKRNTQLMARANESSKAQTQTPASPASGTARQQTPLQTKPGVGPSASLAINPKFVNRDFDALPESTRQIVSRFTTAHIVQSLQDNPMSVGLSEAVLQETATEIFTQVSGLVGSSLKAVAHDEAELLSSKSVDNALTKILSSPICESPVVCLSISTHCRLTLPILPFRHSVSRTYCAHNVDSDLSLLAVRCPSSTRNKCYTRTNTSEEFGPLPCSRWRSDRGVSQKRRWNRNP